MLIVPFGRIFWKEYRVHRSLWISCGVIGCLLQLMFWWLLVRSPHPETEPSQILAAIIPTMYAVGCGALLFAGEREERTSDWLLNLSVPPGPLLMAKFAFAISSTLTLYFLMEILTRVLLFRVLIDDTEGQFVSRFPYGVFVLVWAILGSLLSRRVMPSFFSMFVAAFATVFLGVFSLVALVNLFRFFRPVNFQDPSLFLLFAMLLFAVIASGIDIWLGWRWCQGIYYDGAMFQDVGARLSALRPRWSDRHIAGSRIPLSAEYEQSWRRTWQRLVWHERNRESISRSVLIFGAVVGAPLSIIGTTGVTPGDRNILTLFFFAFLILIPLVMGLLGFRSDANSTQSRFLTTRGIPAGSVWLAKHAVWLSRAFGITTILIAMAWFCDWFVIATNVSHAARSPFQNYLFPILRWQPFSFIWIVLLGYGSGQLAGLLVQRTVLAIVFGLLLNLVSCCWLYLVIFLDVPQWWSLGLPVLAMFFVTFWQMQPSMLENHSWSRLGKLAVALVAIPLTLIAFLAGYRIWEASSPLPIDQSLTERMQYKGRIPQTTALDDEPKRLRLLTLSRIDSPNDDDVVNEITRILNENEVSLAPKYQFEDGSFTFTAQLRKILTNQAETYLNAGQLDKSFDCYRACLRLARSSSRGSSLAWRYGSHIQSWTLESLVNWANHPQQSPEAIRKAIKSIEVELARFPSATEGIVDSFHADRSTWILSSREDVIAKLTQLKALENHSVTFLPVLLLPWERQRADLLISKNAEIQYAAVWSLEKLLEVPTEPAYSKVNRKYSGMSAANGALSRTTPIAQMVNTPLNVVLSSVLDHHTNLRAALTRMELIAFRLEHGELPDRLMRLMETFHGNHLVDPWSSRWFEYYPSFLLSSGSLHASLVPVSPTEVEIVRDSTGSHGERIKFNEIMNDVSYVERLNQDRSISTSLFKIPPKRLL